MFLYLRLVDIYVRPVDIQLTFHIKMFARRGIQISLLFLCQFAIQALESDDLCANIPLEILLNTFIHLGKQIEYENLYNTG